MGCGELSTVTPYYGSFVLIHGLEPAEPTWSFGGCLELALRSFPMSLSWQYLVSPVLKAFRNPLCLTSIFPLTVSEAMWFFPLLVDLWPLTHILGLVRILCQLNFVVDIVCQFGVFACCLWGIQGDSKTMPPLPSLPRIFSYHFKYLQIWEWSFVFCFAFIIIFF